MERDVSAAKKGLVLTFMLLLISRTSLAEGSLNIKLTAVVKFVYMQVIEVVDGHFTVQSDVTRKVPHQIQVNDKEKLFVIY